MKADRLAEVEALLFSGDLTAALAALDQHLIGEPEDDEARRLRAQVRQHSDDPDAWQAALADLAALPALTPPDYLTRAALYQQLADLDSAAAAVAQARQRYPDDEQLTERHLSLLRAAGDHGAAYALALSLPARWRWLRWAGDLAPDDHSAAVHYGQALAHFDATFERTNPLAASLRADLLLRRAGACLRCRDLDAAEADYRAAAELLPGDPAVQFALGVIAFLRGDSVAALRECRAALASAAPDVRAALLELVRAASDLAPLVALLGHAP